MLFQSRISHKRNRTLTRSGIIYIENAGLRIRNKVIVIPTSVNKYRHYSRKIKDILQEEKFVILRIVSCQ